MAAEIHVLSGDRTGLVLPLDGAECIVGRHPACALRFGADAERGVSARHARLMADGDGWILADLQSTNGTWVNGRRIRDDVPLRDGDRIAFGAAGPVVEFRLAGSGIAPAPYAFPPRRRVPPGRLALGAASALVLLVGTAAGVYAIRGGAPASAAAPTDASLEPRAMDRLHTPPLRARPPASADPAVARSADPAPPARSPSRSPARTSAPPPIVARRPPLAAPRAPETPAARAETPSPTPVEAARPIEVDRRNRLAVARIYVEAEDGEVSTGTAFAVRSDGTLVTNRHVLAGRPRRIAVQFAASGQVWRGRVVAVSGEWDLAVVKVDDIEGAVPTVRGLNLRPDTLPDGAPVVMVGFPGGGEPVEGAPIRPSTSHATFGGVRAGRVEVFARSSVGASGSPIFDARGQVIGVLFGGNPRAARPVLYAVPAAALARVLAQR